MEKVCGKCKRTLPVSMFHRKNDSSDGFQDWCKECKAKSSKKIYALRKKAISKEKEKLKAKIKRQLQKEIRHELETTKEQTSLYVSPNFFCRVVNFIKKRKQEKNQEYTIKIPCNKILSISTINEELNVRYKK